MADNVTVSGNTIATRDVGSAHQQRVRAGADQLTISVQSSGLTTATTSYAVGDQVGAIFALGEAATYTGGTGRIKKVVLIDAADIIGAYDVVFYSTSVTLASDNAAFSVSDADQLNFVGIVPLSGGFDLGANHVCQALDLNVPYTCAATTLYAALICRFAHTFFGAATNLQLIVDVERD